METKILDLTVQTKPKSKIVSVDKIDGIPQDNPIVESTLEKTPKQDVFEYAPRKPKSKGGAHLAPRNTNHYPINRQAFLLAAIMLLGTFAGLSSSFKAGEREETADTSTIRPGCHETFNPEDDFFGDVFPEAPFSSSYSVSSRSILTPPPPSALEEVKDDTEVSETLVPAAPDDTETSQIAGSFEEKSEDEEIGQYWLDKLKECGGDASKYFYRIADALGMDEVEAMAYLANLCESEDFGNGCINPVILSAQIMRESSNDPEATGDDGLARGFGQMHACAVDEVNNRFGTTYGYIEEDGYANQYYNGKDDRIDPKKGIEMMLLYLRYCRNNMGYQDGMLAMYNQGNKNGINTTAGKNYVYSVYARLNSLPS